MSCELESTVVADMRHWLESAVIGLNLCPFAKGPHAKGQIHFAVSAARTEQEALQALHAELQGLQAAPAQVRETTLLMFPGMFDDFYRFNDFLDDAEALLEQMGLEGEVQIASFHPHYQFADTEPDAITNATNQAPYPTLHLIRESSIDRAVETYADVDGIPERNMALLEEMGAAGWQALGVKTTVTGDAWEAHAAACPMHAAHAHPTQEPGHGKA